MKRTYHLAIVFAIACACLFPSCSSNKDNTVHLYNWTYYTPQPLIAQFEAETGYKVVIDNFSSNEEMFAKFSAGGGKGYDLIFPSADYTAIMIKLDMLEILDAEALPNLVYLSDIAKEKITYDKDFQYSVPYYIGAAGIAVNRKKVDFDYARSWEIFSDPRFNGRMTLLDDMREVLGVALISLGYSNNTKNPDEIRRAAEKVQHEWKGNILKFDAESFAKSFSRGEIFVAHCYPEAIFDEFPEKDWKDIDFFLPEEGGNLYIDNMVIPKGAVCKEGALAFINFMLRPENHAIFLDTFHFPSTTNKEAGTYMKSTPFFTQEDIKSYELLVDVDKDIETYNHNWQLIRYGK